MPLDLHPKAIQAARDALAEKLSAIAVKNGKYTDSLTVFFAAYEADQTLPSTGRLRDDLEDYIGEYPLIEFIDKTIQRELADTQDYVTDPERSKLPEIERYADTEAVADRLISDFNSLPWSYTLSLPLPAALIAHPVLDSGQISIGPLANLTQADLIFHEQFPPAHPNKKVNERVSGAGLFGLLWLEEPKWQEGVPYYQRNIEGFVGIYGGGGTVARAELELESFLGLGLATRLFTYEYKFENKIISPKWMVHKKEADRWSIETSFKLNDDISNVLSHLVCFKFSNEYPEQNRPVWIQKILSQSRDVFSHEKSQTLLLASKWYFDSYKKSDATLQYIRLITTLEILLGERADTQKASLGEVLGNRLAYLIGKSYSERDEILKRFKRIYGIRSGILHKGKHNLRMIEQQSFAQLRKYCQRAIEAEVEVLLA